MPLESKSTHDGIADLTQLIESHWGYRTLRPLQDRAMRAILDARDSLVVMPTGGGKSLCYQAPALLKPGTTVVVSPLISLMKDQVDGLRANGINAFQLDSSIAPQEKRVIEEQVLAGSVRLLFCSPERLVQGGFQNFLKRAGVTTFAIDEAHCISHWGHDFRPEYRQLNQLKTIFPNASVHAFTATATPHVRDDIIQRLALDNPEVLVGNFDRPNLTYRIIARRDEFAQTKEVLERHTNEAGIIYCIRRKDVDELTAQLNKANIKALGYHAGMTSQQRQAVQEKFANEECDLIVATVAFGMGIDRSNIRFVLHTAMPKSIEHYQQETGRGGRDGLEAECTLLYSGQDPLLWKSIIEKSAADAAAEAQAAGDDLDTTEFVANALKHVDDLDRYCRGAVCRHRVLVEYFGQKYQPPAPPTDPEEAQESTDPTTRTTNHELRTTTASCNACDLCLGFTEELDGALLIAQQILSAVYRVDQRFGIGHITAILRGENLEKIRTLKHDQLKVFGLLKDRGKSELRDLIFQLISQGVLSQENVTMSSGASVPILKLTAKSRDVLKGDQQVRLVQPAHASKEKSARGDAKEVNWDGVDRILFDALRALRRDLAHQRNVPPYVIFGDATLRELARVRPSTIEKMHFIYGIGERKLAEFGALLLPVITTHCESHNIAMDRPISAPQRRPVPTPDTIRMNPIKQSAFDAFSRGDSLTDVVHQTKRSHSTIAGYLAEWIATTKPTSITPWVKSDVYAQISAAIDIVGTDRLKPIFEKLNGNVDYDTIRLVAAHRTTD